MSCASQLSSCCSLAISGQGSENGEISLDELDYLQFKSVSSYLTMQHTIVREVILQYLGEVGSGKIGDEAGRMSMELTKLNLHYHN